MILRAASHRAGRRVVAVVLVAIVKVALRVAPARTLRAVHRSCSEPSVAAIPTDHLRVATLRQLVASIDIASRLMSGPFDPVQGGTCLHSALASCLGARLLRMPVRLRLGVDQLRPDLRAHAWVECAGTVLAGNASPLAFDR